MLSQFEADQDFLDVPAKGKVYTLNADPADCPDDPNVPLLATPKQAGKRKKLGAKTRQVKSRLAYQLRMGAMTLWRNDSELGQFCRRMKARLGKAEDITATAHKIARIIYSLITKGNLYDDKIVGTVTEAQAKRRVNSLQKPSRQARLRTRSAPSTRVICYSRARGNRQPWVQSSGGDRPFKLSIYPGFASR
jgi:hypothetical protein